jgi:protein involved in polysaccharide export with SLBB domain
MNIKFKLIVSVVAITLLTSCSPGMKMKDNEYLEVDLDAILITPALVVKMNVNQINNPIYYVGKQDLLMVRVWSDNDLNTGIDIKANDEKANGLVVQNNGTIFYPYIGNIKVAGKSIEQIRVLLTEKLSEYISDPQISVSMSEYRSKRVHIMGEVRKPGTYPITNMSMSILDAMMLGEINNRTADTEQIFVIRRTSVNNGAVSKPVIYRFDGGSADAMLLAGQFYLNANDVVFVAPAGVVSWNRVISNILPSAGLGAQIDSYGN